MSICRSSCRGSASPTRPRDIGDALDARRACRISQTLIRANCPAACGCGCRSRARLVTRPKLLLMDEPFAALDEITRFRLNNDLLGVWQAMDGGAGTVVFVTHSVFELVFLSSRILVMTRAAGPHLHRDRDRRALSAAAKASAPRRIMPPIAARCRTRCMRRWLWRRPHDAAVEARRDGARAPDALCASGRRRSRSAFWSGTSWCGSNRSRPMCCRARVSCCETLVTDWPILWSSLLVTLATTFEGLLLALVGGVGLAIAVQPVAAGRIFALSLRGDPAGHAGCRDRAAAADLSAAAGGGAGLRLDRRVLSGAREHDARPEFRRPQSRRSVPALRRVATAGPARPETAGGFALHARRPENRGRLVADRRGGRRNRGGLGGRRLGPCLSHRRVRLPAQHPAHVRGAWSCSRSPAS